MLREYFNQGCLVSSQRVRWQIWLQGQLGNYLNTVHFLKAVLWSVVYVNNSGSIGECFHYMVAHVLCKFDTLTKKSYVHTVFHFMWVLYINHTTNTLCMSITMLNHLTCFWCEPVEFMLKRLENNSAFLPHSWMLTLAF